ncbi:tRNA (cytidine(56)-2'-O)-methyltransferase [miscellaneous Crenarchaeota group-15 archaeon DG-45]|uniref:tRNA (cytidine(56)-2'-O)-methyltransferase n=1 Tax=miscellaneous Crenarchaeota group-15 archaeon DG-45 TaxID=1685127 RepID=A0A0M0BSL9_9ARCH|nr:MAG: tRNA (cytidine(56)-2'-O)-methyltransferase [miscellaneous Crenarchaeota group-15 archaeon DG-45]
MSIYVLRLGHRPARDKRITSHLMLTARAFGASGVIYTGIRDPKVEETVRRACADWGGPFSVEYADDWRGAIKQWKRRGKVIHLTMYGLPIQEAIAAIRDDPSDKLLAVGGAKVPGGVYSLADWNVAVTSQPHSEVSALAVFLHELLEGAELDKVFEGARLWVVPQERGKRVEGAPGTV